MSQPDLYLEDNASKIPALELLQNLCYLYIAPEEYITPYGVYK